jgi:endoglucanase
VLVAAHLDEIGLIVRHIDDRGFLWFETLAGIHPQQLFGRHVIVKTETGHVNGVVNHINPGRPKPCAVMPDDLSDFFIDIGAFSRIEAEEMGVEVGNSVSLQYPTLFLGKNGGLVAGKALDDRACVYQLIELVRLLADDPSGPDLYAVFTTQEEVGGRGAIVAAENIRPDIAIALDMSLSTDLPTFPDRSFVNRVGGGASIKIMDRSRFAACGLIADPDIVRGMKQTARQRGLSYQLEAYAAGATDASLMQTKAGGIRCGGIQIPMRYVHSYEAAAVSDILDSLELLYFYVKEL